MTTVIQRPAVSVPPTVLHLPLTPHFNFPSKINLTHALRGRPMSSFERAPSSLPPPPCFPAVTQYQALFRCSKNYLGCSYSAYHRYISFRNGSLECVRCKSKMAIRAIRSKIWECWACGEKNGLDFLVCRHCQYGRDSSCIVRWGKWEFFEWARNN